MSNLNVEHLAHILRAYKPPPPGVRPPELDLAIYLAMHGVLVISDAVLTDEVIDLMVNGPPPFFDWDATSEQVRGVLSRLAKGEAP